MRVTRLEPVTKTKFKVYLEERFAFVLYKGELSRYRIQEDMELSQDIIEEIKREIIAKRVKLRAMHLLTQMDRSEAQLRERLKRDMYTDEFVDIALVYVKSFDYIEDENFARRYAESKRDTKSKVEIKMALLQKGVSKEIVNRVLEENYSEENECHAIQKILAKKRFSPENATDVEKKKMFAYLLRKGFSYDEIRQVIQVSYQNA